eukprot:10945904-Karenia_brevis.AAC.1
MCLGGLGGGDASRMDLSAGVDRALDHARDVLRVSGLPSMPWEAARMLGLVMGTSPEIPWLQI